MDDFSTQPRLLHLHSRASGHPSVHAHDTHSTHARHAHDTRTTHTRHAHMHMTRTHTTRTRTRKASQSTALPCSAGAHVPPVPPEALASPLGPYGSPRNNPTCLSRPSLHGPQKHSPWPSHAHSRGPSFAPVVTLAVGVTSASGVRSLRHTPGSGSLLPCGQVDSFTSEFPHRLPGGNPTFPLPLSHATYSISPLGTGVAASGPRSRRPAAPTSSRCEFSRCGFLAPA